MPQRYKYLHSLVIPLSVRRKITYYLPIRSFVINAQYCILMASLFYTASTPIQSTSNCYCERFLCIIIYYAPCCCIAYSFFLRYSLHICICSHSYSYRLNTTEQYHNSSNKSHRPPEQYHVQEYKTCSKNRLIKNTRLIGCCCCRAT